MFTTFLSLLALSSLLSLFLLHRLYIHITSSPTSSTKSGGLDMNQLSTGVKSWLEETKTRLPVLPTLPSGTSINTHWRPSTTTTQEGWVLGPKTDETAKKGLDEGKGLNIKLGAGEVSFDGNDNYASGVGKGSLTREINPILGDRKSGPFGTTGGTDAIGVNWSPPS